MNRQQFYEAIVRYETDLNRKGNWAVVGLLAAILVSMLVVLLIPTGSGPSPMVFALGIVVVLLVYGVVLRIFNRRAAEKHGMICNQCQSLLDLRHIGFTRVCAKCGAIAFAESNSTIEGDARESSARPSL